MLPAHLSASCYTSKKLCFSALCFHPHVLSEFATRSSYSLKLLTQFFYSLHQSCSRIFKKMFLGYCHQYLWTHNIAALAEESSTHQALRISTKLELECGVSNPESCDLGPKDGRDIVDIWEESSEKSILICERSNRVEINITLYWKPFWLAMHLYIVKAMNQKDFERRECSIHGKVRNL